MSTPAQLLTFRTGRHWYACDLLWVREIVRQPAITPVDRAPPDVRGLIHLRGQILTALDLEQRLGSAPTENSRATDRCIVFKTAAELLRVSRPPVDADLANEDLIGLIVDEIGDILQHPPEPLPAPPDTLSGLKSEFIHGVIPAPTGLITALKIGDLLSPLESTTRG